MTATGALAAAIALFVLPGFFISWVAGAKAPAAAASALPVTFGVMGMSAWMWGETTAPFNMLTFGISFLFTLGCAVVWRRFMARPGRGFSFDAYWVLPALGVVTGAWMLASDRLKWLDRLPHGTNTIVQGWDVQWHANVVRYIMEEGVASPTRMGEVRNLETAGHLFYPSGFHAGTALFAQASGLEAIPALNVAAAILPALALPAAMACLVFAMTQSRGVTTQIAAALAAIASYAIPTLMWVPDYVGMWPYMLAVFIAVIVVWQFCAVPERPETALPAAVGFMGVLVVHPSAVTIVVLGVALYWLTRLVFVPVRSRLKDFFWLAAPALVAAGLFLPQIVQGSEQAEEVSAVEPPGENVDPAGAWATVLLMRTRHSLQFFPDFNPVPLLWLAAAGAVALIFWRRQIWSVVMFAISALVVVNVLEPFGGWLQDALAAISSLHYNTAHRLVMPVSMLTLAAAAVGAAVVIRVLTLAPLAARNGTAAWTRATAAAALALAVAAGAGTCWWAKDSAYDGAKESFVGPRLDDRMVNNNDRIAFDWLGSQPAAREGLTVGEPADGYSWLYAYNGVPTLDKHYDGGRGFRTELLQRHPDALGEAAPVDQAARDLDVRFILSSPGNFWWGQVPPYPQLKGLWASEGVTPVFKRGTTVIFAVNDAFTRSELHEMRRDAQRNGSEELPEVQ
ncbi:DUF6541 family protein [Corynebacterium qintianiae]|uniref:DUF6541 family protein n=1 Tax=Corynebacterium qintianiae TaxID=2709392 RepID=UPI0013EDB938|nr:DUF6541 family protein [Corynebacterium qintianiae]